jgi:hypothetical protein
MTSTFSSLKPNGVLLTMIIIKHNVFMRTIFKTSEENLIFSDTTQNFVKTGKVELSSLAMKKDAKDYKLALSVMGGKSSNFIL